MQIGSILGWLLIFSIHFWPHIESARYENANLFQFIEQKFARFAVERCS